MPARLQKLLALESTLERDFKPIALSALCGRYPLRGQAVTFVPGYFVELAAGSYAVTGQSIAFHFDYDLAAELGSYALNGQTVTFDVIDGAWLTPSGDAWLTPSGAVWITPSGT